MEIPRSRNLFENAEIGELPTQRHPYLNLLEPVPRLGKTPSVEGDDLRLDSASERLVASTYTSDDST